jgi:hypothetical protein
MVENWFLILRSVISMPTITFVHVPPPVQIHWFILLLLLLAAEENQWNSSYGVDIPQTTLWAISHKTTLSGLNGHNLAQSSSIKISLVPINSLHSREWIDTKFVIYYTFFVKIEFLNVKFRLKKFYLYKECVIYDKFGINPFPRM